MSIKNIFNFFALLLIFTGFSACQNTDRSGHAQLDSAPVGSDSLRMKDSLPASNDVTQKSKVDGDGAAFMDTAAIGGMMEVDLGKLTLEKSTNSRVREFAAQMVADHTK